MHFRRLLASYEDNKAIADTRQLQQILRHLGIVAEHIEEAVAIINTAGVLHFANTRWAQMHGYKSSDEVVGRNIRAFWAKGGTEKNIKELIKQAESQGHCDCQGEHTHKSKAGFGTQLKMRSLKDDEGRCEGIVILARPVPEQAKCNCRSGEPSNHLPGAASDQQSKHTGNSGHPQTPAPGMNASQLKELKELAELAKRLR